MFEDQRGEDTGHILLARGQIYSLREAIKCDKSPADPISNVRLNGNRIVMRSKIGLRDLQLSIENPRTDSGDVSSLSLDYLRQR